jgi:hypothetical protein
MTVVVSSVARSAKLSSALIVKVVVSVSPTGTRASIGSKIRPWIAEGLYCTLVSILGTEDDIEITIEVIAREAIPTPIPLGR